MQALIEQARQKYHAGLLANSVLTVDGKGIPSNADSSSKLSISIAQEMLDILIKGKSLKDIRELPLDLAV